MFFFVPLVAKEGLMDLIYGTSNISKVNHMKKMIKNNSGINIIGFAELKIFPPIIKENGNSPIENARIKASKYYDIIKRPVFACDTGLYFENTFIKQPGVNVRRVNGKELNDNEMIEYYSSLADKNGGEIIAYYKNAICLVMDVNNIFEYDGDTISSDKFLICNEAHEIIKKGFPLDTLSKDIKSKKYFYDLEKKNKDNSRIARGFNTFFEDIILI